MRTPAQHAADRLTKGQRARTNQSASMRAAATGGAARIAMDEFASWTGNVPTVMKVFRFGRDAATRGFGKGGLA